MILRSFHSFISFIQKIELIKQYFHYVLLGVKYFLWLYDHSFWLAMQKSDSHCVTVSNTFWIHIQILTSWSQLLQRNRNKFKCWKDMFLRPWMTLIDASCWLIRLIDWNAINGVSPFCIMWQGQCLTTSGWGFLIQSFCFVFITF